MFEVCFHCLRRKCGRRYILKYELSWHNDMTPNAKINLDYINESLLWWKMICRIWMNEPELWLKWQVEFSICSRYHYNKNFVKFFKHILTHILTTQYRPYRWLCFSSSCNVGVFGFSGMCNLLRKFRVVKVNLN